MKKQTFIKTNWIVAVAVIVISVVTLAACNLPGSEKPLGDPIEQAKQTLIAQQTQEHFQTLVAQLTATVPVESTEPVEPVEPTESPVVQPSNTVEPTAVPATSVPPTAVPPTAVPPTAVPTRPAPTATPIPCYQLSFVADVTIPDGTKIPGGNTFTKTWRIKNTGSCTWDERFDVAFVRGTQLAASAIYDFRKVVKPGETVEISIEMTAPTTNGVYTSEWQMVNPNGVKFGGGPKSDGTFWAKIEVVDGKGAIYNFATSACDADWSSDLNSKLPCPGDRKKAGQGYVIYEKNPIREDGGKENEPGLITRPSPTVNGGYIQGIYPAINIKSGDEFRALIQCEGGAEKCSLKFELYYKIGDGKFIELGEWIEVYEKKWNTISIDLSALAGNKVTFSLVVWNHGTAEDNIGLWLDPIIYRP
ncbi:MAG TPA: NBR1-Ig-like domain-containing protein [Anaerolineaceae bacterium]|nr:NBR1-Ig-like domain-containing protein [Anaerolineaceae bacterium]